MKNCQQGAALRTALEEMSHQQLPKLVATDSTTTGGFVNDNIQQQNSKAIGARLYWVHGRVRQGK